MFYEVTVRPWTWLHVDGVTEAPQAAGRHISQQAKNDAFIHHSFVPK